MAKRNLSITLWVVAGVSVYSTMVHAGSLEPSALPGPTMKTLDEVEPRIPISPSSSPTGVFTISSSGSYYLQGDRLCSGTGIQVDANDVTIDLMGYRLIGPDSGTNYGVHMDGRSNVEIRNGTIRDFFTGVYEESVGGRNHRVIGVRVISNIYSGIILGGSGNLIKNCMVRKNGNSTNLGAALGISTGLASTVAGNTVNANGVSVTSNAPKPGSVYGIHAGSGSRVADNSVYDNGDSASIWVYGLHVGSGCVLTGNAVYSNGTSASGEVKGIDLDPYCVVDQNTAYDNGFGAPVAFNMNVCGTCAFGTNVAP